MTHSKTNEFSPSVLTSGQIIAALCSIVEHRIIMIFFKAVIRNFNWREMEASSEIFRCQFSLVTVTANSIVHQKIML